MSSDPRRAATILVLRPTPTGDDVEVLLVRRGHRASFMANAYVFPGGRVDPADAEPTPDQATRRCAARELMEEASLRVDDPATLVYFARWVTPSQEPKRFDTDFFLWALPPDQQPQVDAQEVFDLRWLSPSAAIAAYENDGLNLPPPTVSTLEDLRAEVAAQRATDGDPTTLLMRVLAAARRRQPLTLLPRACVSQSGGFQIVLPWDPDFATIPGEGDPAPCMALGAADVAHRICRCTLEPPGVWRATRL